MSLTESGFGLSYEVGVSLLVFGLSLAAATVSSSARLWWLWPLPGNNFLGFSVFRFQRNGADKVSGSGSVIGFMHETALYHCIQL